MKILNLEKRTDHGYTFQLNLGPFIIGGWWYNRDTNNIVPPTKNAGGTIYPLVKAPGIHIKKIRDLVAKMVDNGLSRFDNEVDAFGLTTEQERLVEEALEEEK